MRTDDERHRLRFEGYSADELIALPRALWVQIILTGDPVEFRVGTAHVLGQFRVTGDVLVVELAHIDGGGEGALVATWSLASRLAADTQNYVKYQLQQAGGNANLLSDDAVRAVFPASQGVPRRINQLVLHALIHAVVDGRDDIDGRYMSGQIAAHPPYARVDG